MSIVKMRHVVFAAAAIAITTVLTVAALLAADLYLHHRANRSAGVNVWGYRGPVASKKRPGDVRIAVLGGSTVFGYGVMWDESFPAQLEQRLNAGAGTRRFSVVNLGYNNEGAYSFRYTLEDYAYLHADVVCLYEGYNDLAGYGANESIYRHASPLFRVTGYFPILPLVFREKAMAIRYGGDLNAAYVAEGKTVFEPTLAARAKSGALTAAADIGASIEQQIARLGTEAPAPTVAPAGRGCSAPWIEYCQRVSAAIDYALAAGQRVIVVGQPHLTGDRGRDRQIRQQRAVAAMVHERYAGRRDVQYVDLGGAVDLNQPAMAFDGMHLTREGNARIADRLVPTVLIASRREPAA
jgi:lysophospholipase L1-like esterase